MMVSPSHTSAFRVSSSSHSSRAKGRSRKASGQQPYLQIICNLLAERPHGSLERALEKDLSLISISVPSLIAKCLMGQLLQLPALLFSLVA